MFTRQLIGLRERFHPLHKLRQSPLMARHILPLFDRPIFITMHGVGWPVRVRRMRHATYVVDNRALEPGVVAVFRTVQELAAPRVFWDVGANMGFYSWLLMTADPALQVVLFEPDPDNILLLQATIAHAGLQRVALVTAAASAVTGMARFVMDADSGSTSHLESGGSGVGGSVIEVETTTLDTELGRHPPPDLMKIDVEGAEGLVLAGASALMETHKPWIIIEAAAGLGSAPMQVLAAAGYSFANADDPLKPASTGANFLCIPRGATFTVEHIAARFPHHYDRWIAGR